MERIYDLPFCFYNLIYLRQKNGRGFQTELFRNFFGLNYLLLKKDYNTIKADISYYVSGKITGDIFWKKKLKIVEYYAEYAKTSTRDPIKTFCPGSVNYSTKEEDGFILAMKERIYNMYAVSAEFWGILCERRFLKETITFISHSNVPKDSTLYVETAKIDQLLKDYTDLKLDNELCKDVISEFWYQAILYCLRHNDTIANAENIGNLAHSIRSLGRHISFSCVIGNATHISSLPYISDTPCGTSKSLYNAGVSATTNMRRNRRSPALRCERIHSAALLTGSCHSYGPPPIQTPKAHS